MANNNTTTNGTAATASALPPQHYTDPAFYAAEEATIFRKQWVPVARADELEKAGDYVAYDLAGAPIVVARWKDGGLRAMSATCLHRYMPVVEGAGNRTSFQCPYHLWTYGLDGQLIGAPEMDRAEGLSISDCRLPEIRVETWEGFVFVNLDASAPALAPQLATLTEKLRTYRIGEMRTAGTLEYESDWNWKIMVENFIESYHHIGVHPDTLQPFFPASGTSHDDIDGPYVFHLIPTKDRALLPAKFSVPDDLLDDYHSQLTVISVFPLLLFALQPDEMDVLQIIPESIGRHRVRWSICYRPDAWSDPVFEEKLAGSKAILDAVHRQDMDACRSVQRGVVSPFARPGRLSHLEKGVWQFNDWVREQLAAAS
jgi:phenylpropionate dioxygenase-like ring-hydroxylating dioxygenase large terminal subunit